MQKQIPMGCEFTPLYTGENGYVVRCRQCGHYQVAFISTALSLNKQEFHFFRQLVAQKSTEFSYAFAEHSKCVILETACTGICLILTWKELNQLHQVLETADAEAQALDLIILFNK
ncbi:MAG: DUF6686 family protein [Flavihumibacter sp.]|nr:DUF6686 family protein [Flavihumibacter sp.]